MKNKQNVLKPSFERLEDGGTLGEMFFFLNPIYVVNYGPIQLKLHYFLSNLLKCFLRIYIPFFF